MFTSDVQLLSAVSQELESVGCCARCVLRYLGLKDMYAYKGDHLAMQKLVQQQQQISDKEKCAADSKIGETDSCSTKDSGGMSEAPAEKENSTNNTCMSGDGKGLNGCEEQGGCEPDQTVPDIPTCMVCLGILQKYATEEFLNQIKEHITHEGFHYVTYMCSLMVPVCIILREHSLWLHLQEKFKDVYEGRKLSDVAPVKDVWKWRCGPLLNNVLQAPFDARSCFEITLTFQYKNAEKECNFLLDSDGDETFRQRKQDRRYNKKKKKFPLFTRTNVAKAVESMSAEDFKKNFQSPPSPPVCDTTCNIQCQNENVFVAGRYNKYSRILSQSPWLIEGVRRSESSVEELLSTEICRNFRPSESKFSASGREDVDVLMLGNGRPFMIELMNPRRREFTQEQMNEMQKTLNASTKDVQCTNLQVVPKEETDILKQGEIDKVKKYRALCWSKLPVTDDQLQKLSNISELKILQKTPIRVLHRRPLATRDRIIHSMTAQRANENHFMLDMSTQAGTYIKEFVHGDFGRTRPNVCSLLSQDCDILELDVMAVELDWPKQIQLDT